MEEERPRSGQVETQAPMVELPVDETGGVDAEAARELLSRVQGERDALERDVQELCAPSSQQGHQNRDGLKARLAFAHSQLQHARETLDVRTLEVGVLRRQAKQALATASDAAQYARVLQQQKDDAEHVSHSLRHELAQYTQQSQQLVPLKCPDEDINFSPVGEKLSSLADEVSRLQSQLNAATNELQAERARRRYLFEHAEQQQHTCSSPEPVSSASETTSVPAHESPCVGSPDGATVVAVGPMREEIHNLRHQVESFMRERDNFRQQLAAAVQEKVEALLLWQQELQEKQHAYALLRATDGVNKKQNTRATCLTPTPNMVLQPPGHRTAV